MMFLGKSDTGGRKQVREEDRQGVQRNGEKRRRGLWEVSCGLLWVSFHACVDAETGLIPTAGASGLAHLQPAVGSL